MITSDTNFRGNFDSIEAVWEAIPYGGVEGDYLNIQGVKYRWNKYLAMWENAEVVTETPARETVTFDEDVNMQNNLTVAGVLRAKKFVVDDLPTGIEDVEIVESAVSGGNNVITFTYTNGESQTFIIKNGEAGKTMGAFGYASSTASQSTWNTAKNYLVPTANEGEFDVYTYEGDAWYQVDTFQVDIAGTADAVEYDDTTTQLGADNVQEAIEAVTDKIVEVEEVLVTTIVDTIIEQYKGNVNTKTSGSTLSKIWGNRHNVASVVDGIYWKCHGDANSLSVYQAKSGSATLIKTFQKDLTWIDGQWIKLYFDNPVTIQSGCYIGVYGYAYFGTTSGVGLQFYCNQNGSGWGSDNNVTIGVYSFYEKSRFDEIEESIEDKQNQIDAINEDIDSVIDKTYYVDRLPLVTTTDNKFVWYSNGQVTYSTLNGFVYTDFIYIGDCNKMKIPACHQWGCVFFDGSKQYNGDYHTSGEVTTPVTINIPSGSQYVQVNLKKTDSQYVDCYFTTPLRKLSLNVRTPLILDRDGNELILPLDRIITEPSGGQTSLSEDRFTQTGATSGGYLTAAKSEDVWTTTWHSSSPHCCTNYIDIHDATKLTIGCDVTANLVYFDENKVCCGNFVGNGSLTAKTTTPPDGAYYLRMNYDTKKLSITYLTVYFNVDTYNLNPIIAIPSDNIPNFKPLSGLKVAWYGTSIPHGYPYQNSDQATYSYANRAVTELGGIIQNRCVSGGFIISATNTADTHNQTSRFTDIDPEGTYYSAVNYKTKIIDLIGTADEPDIFVFDWGANDGQFYQSYFNGINLDTVDITTEDIKTFIGAYNTIIKALLTAKPKARIFLVTHYSDDGQSNEMTRKDGYRTMNRLIEKIADYWHIPCNPVYKKTGWIYNRNGISNIRSQWCKDGIHPANSANVGSIEFLTKIHKQFLMENHCY